MQEAVEKAKREADVLRKARLFKHVLEADDSNAELTNKLLGIDEKTAGINVNRVNEQVCMQESRIWLQSNRWMAICWYVCCVCL